MSIQRCKWVDDSSLYKEYHDKEWGNPVHDEQKLFEMLSLESMQAGLSWITVLKKRDAFLEAFDNFDYHKVSLYNEQKVEELVLNEGIIRHRGKINAIIGNANAFIKVQEEFGSFDSYIWAFVDNEPVIGHWKSASQVPATTKLSDTISKDLKRRGFKFVGSTITYAFMQATGMVNDHTTDCFCYNKKG